MLHKRYGNANVQNICGCKELIANLVSKTYCLSLCKSESIDNQ